MTEPEGFEDDLFADLYVPDPISHTHYPCPAEGGMMDSGPNRPRLTSSRYNDDEGSKAPPQSADQPPASDAPVVEDASATAAETNGKDDYQPADQDDDDNEVDFDLGDAQQPVLSPVPAAQGDVPESPPPPVAGSSTKAPGSSKEDG